MDRLNKTLKELKRDLETPTWLKALKFWPFQVFVGLILIDLIFIVYYFLQIT